MYGAIEFMRAWRDECNEPHSCADCPIQKQCGSEAKTEVWDLTNAEINNLITAVMARKAQREKEENK